MCDTQPIPLIVWSQPTLVQLRQQCGMSQMQVAVASGVRLCRVAWMESGIESSAFDILLVLSVYSGLLGHSYLLEDVRSLKVRKT